MCFPSSIPLKVSIADLNQAGAAVGQQSDDSKAEYRHATQAGGQQVA